MAVVMAIMTAKPVSAARRTEAATSPPTSMAKIVKATVKAMMERKLGSTKAANGFSGIIASTCEKSTSPSPRAAAGSAA